MNTRIPSGKLSASIWSRESAMVWFDFLCHQKCKNFKIFHCRGGGGVCSNGPGTDYPGATLGGRGEGTIFCY